MLFAELRGTGRIISAAKASRYGDYRCPTCRAEVFLRAGHVYDHHFAHVPGQGSSKCDEYHPPEHLRRQWETSPSQSTQKKIDGLILSIELEPVREASRRLRGWGLRLTIPKSYDSHGVIEMDLGGGDLRRVALTTLTLGAQTYRADPGARDFGASWLSYEVGPEYRQAVEHRIVGLNPLGVTAFQSVPQKLKPRRSILRWGESYYFVWRSDRPIEFPLSLPCSALTDNSGWSCRLISLPDRSVPDVEEWLNKMCELQVAPATREWALIYPPPYGFDQDGSLNVHSTALLLLAIRPVAETGALTVSGLQTGLLELSGVRRHIVEIGVGHQTQQQPIRLAWDEMPLNSLVARSYTESAIGHEILFEFGHGMHRSRVPLHMASSHVELMRVRSTDSVVVGVRFDPRLRGRLRFRRAGKFDWQDEELSQLQSDRNAPTDALSSAQVDRLNEVLKDCSLEMVVDFGAYGVFHANASIPSKRRQVRIPRRLRGRIEWLCKAARAFVDDQRRPLHSIDDAALLRHLVAVRTPVALLPNRRAIDRHLCRIDLGLPK